MELAVVIVDWEGERRYAYYDYFQVGSEDTKYVLTVGNYSGGDAGDGLSTHNGMKFSTKDQKNNLSTDGDCANIYSGAWWYYNCFRW